LIAVGCLLSARPVQAYRPFDGTDADVADFGEFELELAPIQPVRVADKTYLEAPASVLNLGALPRTELIVDLVGLKPLDPEPGESGYQLSDPAVSFKVLLWKGVLQESGSGPSIALESGLHTPGINADPGFGASANIIVSERWQWFFVHLNSEGALSRKELVFSLGNMLITEFKVSDIVWPVMELTWEHEMVHDGATAYSALAGVIWSVTEGLDLDGAVVAGRDDGETVLEARLGLTWAFAVWGGENEKEEGAAHE
jgi:hypothetical protein